MGAYASTTTLSVPKAKKILGYPGLGMVFGSVNITNYNAVLAEITAITSLFRLLPVPTVIVGGPSSLGYMASWIPASKSFKCWYSNGATAHTHDLLFIGGIAITEPVAIAAGDTLGKNAATNRTVAGATSAAKGGVVASAEIAAGVLIQVADDTNVGVLQIVAFGRV